MAVELKKCRALPENEWRLLSGLYVSAFPDEERRDVEQLKNMIDTCCQMVFNEIIKDGELAGFQIYWDFGDFCYLEHFAVFEQMRGGGTGAAVLGILKEQLRKPLVLEVEPAEEGTMTARRVAFYERNGFGVLPVEYVQPDYHGNGDAMPLWIMSTETPPPDTAAKWVETIKREVYRKWLVVSE